MTIHFRTSFLSCVIASFVPAVLPPAFAQTNTTAGERTPGVHIAVRGGDNLTPDQLAGLLENYARQIRAKDAPAPKVLPDPLAIGPVPNHPVATETGNDRPGVADPSEPVVHGLQRQWTAFPATLLWQPPLANPTQPRFYAKENSLSTREFDVVNDFNIGGTMALLRSSPAGRPNDGWQLDMFAMVLSRFGKRDKAVATDYRFGLPITLAKDRWSGKIAYEHTSTHLGDEFVRDFKVLPRHGIRDEISFGLAYRPVEVIRVYGVFAYAPHMSTFVPNPRKERYDVGVEWSRPQPTGWRGQPFAAVDVESYGETQVANITAQFGWQWIADSGRPGKRLALEYFDGRSPFAQFLDRHESYFGFGLFFDY